MSDIIKSGIFIEGVEVTSEHIGREFTFLKSPSAYLAEGCDYKLLRVGESTASFLDNENNINCLYDIDVYDFDTEEFILSWKDKLPSPLKSTLTSRKKMAKEIKEVHKALQLAIENAEKYGMIVDASEGVKITYNPPVEEY